MMSEDFILRMKQFTDEEDIGLWGMGDTMRDAVPPLKKDDIRKLADIVHRTPAVLKHRRDVSVETTEDKRRPGYSWTLYSIFSRIEDPAIRWELLFSRPGNEWTIETATKVVRDTNYAARGSHRVASSVARGQMLIGGVLIKGHLTQAGKLILQVNLGEEYAVAHTVHHESTTVTFVP